jgi:hypothetical protein
LEATLTTINNQNAVLNLFLKITGVGAASCREAAFSIPQRRIRLKDGRFKTSKSGFKSLDRAEAQRGYLVRDEFLNPLLHVHPSGDVYDLTGDVSRLV